MKLLLCYLVAFALNFAFFRWIPLNLRKVSSSVGRPLFEDFDIGAFWWRYYAELVAVPLAAWFLYRFLTPAPPSLKHSESHFPSGPSTGSPFLFLRMVAVGAFLGLGFADLDRFGALGCLLLGVLGYGILACGVAAVCHFKRAKVLGSFHRLNLIAVCAAPFSIARLSSVTRGIFPEGVVPYPWFSVGSACVASLVCLGVVLVLWKRTGGASEPVAQLETQVVGHCLLPLALFIGFASKNKIGLPEVSLKDLFHPGEHSAPAQFLWAGAFPWRDFIFIHGILQDGLGWLLGYRLFAQNLWGSTSGLLLLVTPLSVTFYLLAIQKMAPRDWAFLCLCFLLLLTTKLIGPWTAQYRFSLSLLTYIPFVFYLEKPTWVRAAVFSFLAILQTFLTPELFYLGVSYALTCVLADGLAYRSRRGTFSRLSYSIPFGVCSVVFLCLGFGYLHAHGALADFFRYYSIISSEHPYGGGHDLEITRHFYHLRILSLALVAGYLFAGLSAWRNRKKPTPVELSMVAYTVAAILFYQKFLARAGDAHLIIYLAAIMPLIPYALYRLLRCLDAKVPSRLFLRPITVGLFVCLLLLNCVKIENLYASLGKNVSVPLRIDPEFPELGPVTLEDSLRPRFRQLRSFFRNTPESDSFFDFTSQPFLFYYLLKKPLHNRFFAVQPAIQLGQQKWLVEDLKKEPPRYVFFRSDFSTISDWDGISDFVRYHWVSRYLLENYTPFTRAAGLLVLERKTVNSKPLSENLYADFPTCDWGFVPDYWSGRKLEAGTRNPMHADWQVTVLNLPPRPQRGDSLEVGFERVGEDELRLGLRESTDRKTDFFAFKTHGGKGLRFRLGLGSCPQAVGLKGGKVFLYHHEPLAVQSVAWTSDPLEPSPRTYH